MSEPDRFGALFRGSVRGVGIAPLLGLRVRNRGASERVAIAADHLLYGLVVTAPPAKGVKGGRRCPLRTS
jgi:hypothetical protein